MYHLKTFEEIDFRHNNESINTTRSGNLLKKSLGILFSPLTTVFFANLDTNKKIQAYKKLIYEEYIEERAEYLILDEVKYDIEQPSILKKYHLG